MNDSAGASPASIAGLLSTSRRDLLDITLRNPLLSFRPLRAKGVQVVDESPREVFRRLVEKKSGMYFVPAPDQTEPAAGPGAPEPQGATRAGQLPPAGDEPALNGLGGLGSGRGDPVADSPARPPSQTGGVPPPPVGPRGDDATGHEPTAAEDPAERQLDNKLQTAHVEDRMEMLLRNTLRHARSSIEEQGVNILYLALGMLVWYESDSSETERRAPLVLVPVELDRASLRARFRVRWNEDEIEANLSLDAKMRRDFQVPLPDLEDAEDLDVDVYFDQVEQAVSRLPRWKVDRQAVHLGFFSFSKLLIYKDLDVDAWPGEEAPDQHPVVRSLYGDGFERDPSAADPDDGGPWLDERPEAGEMHQVLDSDSSQTLAVLDAVAGRNLVVQGPPGTGKSQTITNLVAECVARGKTVLFVAEKMAALEVVKRRLDGAHAGDACLELHSHNANKAAVLAELERTLHLGRPQPPDAEDATVQLERSRDRLNEYSRAVNSPVGLTKLTPQQLIGELARTGGPDGPAGAPPLELPGAASWSRDEFDQRAEGVSELESLVATTGVPRKLPFWGSALSRYMPADRSRVAEALDAATAALRRHRADAERLGEMLGAGSERLGRRATETLLATAARVAEAPDLAGVRHGAPEWTERVGEIEALASDALELARLRTEHDSALIPEAWEQPGVLVLRQGLASSGGSWLRFLSPGWRRAAKELRGLCRDEPPKDHRASLILVDAVLIAQRLKDAVERARPLLARLFDGPAPGWDADASRRIGETAEWLLRMHGDVASGAVHARAPALLDDSLDAEALSAAASACRRSAEQWAEAMNALAAVLELDEARFAPLRPPAARPFAETEAWLARAAADVDALQGTVRFNRIAKRMEEGGLVAVAEAAAGWEDAGRQLARLFRNRCCAVWIEAAWRERPVLAEFDGVAHQDVVDRFRRLDEEQFAHNRARVALKHWEGVPRDGAGGQMGVLLREFEKKRRHLPVRKLMQRAGAAIQAIKPVFMMSPLSIAKFVPPGSVRFDLVIFDEASQVRPVDALGAIMRASQAVVVGDSKQLPPTTFFDRIADEDDEDADHSLTSDLESVLGMFCAQQAPQRMLRWHYRSRHESLIAVSNAEFYDGRLVVFPSPDKGRENSGLSLAGDSESFYKGGAGGRVNRGEAKAVARAAMRHARDEPGQTLGVAAFSVAQARCIEDELEILRRGDPSAEAFFSEHPEEPFFVKNLENVQGDERDVILISVGYGRTEDGRMSMNFGPLNNDGGERRLNVLITRARRRCVVHANFDADHLDLRRTSSRGVQALKKFLYYARTGQLDVPTATGREADSPFEEAVASALRARGHQVEHQIGSAGFFVDLAVVDPARPGRYLLGIECDGATYHSARSARDRDRLRQQVLEGLGWTIHRIWSTDWFMRPERETDRAEEAIIRVAEQAASRRRTAGTVRGEDTAAGRPPASSRPGEAAGGSDAPRHGPPPTERLSAGRDRAAERGLGEADRSAQAVSGGGAGSRRGAGSRAKAVESAPPDSQRGAPSSGVEREQRKGLRRGPPVRIHEVADPSVPYRVAEPDVRLALGELHERPWPQGAEWLAQVVAVESPVRLEEAAARLARAAGARRTGSRIMEWARNAARLGARRGQFVERNGYLWRPDHGDVAVRRRDGETVPGSLRQVGNIAPEEIREALLHAVRASRGIEDGDVVREAARLFGFKRAGAKVQAGLRQALDELKADGVLETRGGFLQLRR